MRVPNLTICPAKDLQGLAFALYDTAVSITTLILLSPILFIKKMAIQLGFLEPLDWTQETQKDYSISRLGGLPVQRQRLLFDDRLGLLRVLLRSKTCNAEYAPVHCGF